MTPHPLTRTEPTPDSHSFNRHRSVYSGCKVRRENRDYRWGQAGVTGGNKCIRYSESKKGLMDIGKSGNHLMQSGHEKKQILERAKMIRKHHDENDLETKPPRLAVLLLAHCFLKCHTPDAPSTANTEPFTRLAGVAWSALW